MARKILNFGSLNIDYVYVMDHIVREGETASSLDYQVFEGGKGLNQSVALAKAGGEVYHAGRIGKEGIFLKDALERCGVDCRYLSVDDGANGHAIIQRSVEGENCIILYPGANHKITCEDMDQVLDQFAAGDILVCQNEISEMEYLIDKAYEKGLFDKVFTTNLIYTAPEVLDRPWYSSVNMCKYVAYIIDTLNHDQSISTLLNPVGRIRKLLDEQAAKNTTQLSIGE